jgi:hypothetical protein
VSSFSVRPSVYVQRAALTTPLALRTHALLPKIRSAPSRRGLLPRDKLGSPSMNRF